MRRHVLEQPESTRSLQMRRAVRSTKGSIGAARSLQDFLGAPEAMRAQDRSLHQEPLEPQEPSGPPKSTGSLSAARKL